MTHNDVLRANYGTTVAHCVKRIESMRARATDSEIVEGVNFYPVALEHARILASFPHIGTTERGAAVLAALSPRTYWDKNVLHAYACATGSEYPRPIMGSNKERAERVVASSDHYAALGDGPKVKAFYANILGDTDAVTIDTWAIRIALGRWMDDNEQNKIKNAGVYDALAHCYRVAARKAGTEPSIMQAITWIVVRDNKNLVRK